MIIEVRRLDFECKVCGLPAMVEIRRTNADLPDGYMKAGTRSETYCKDHIPQEAKDMWNFSIPDMPNQQFD